jgi:hypothetical protein
VLDKQTPQPDIDLTALEVEVGSDVRLEWETAVDILKQQHGKIILFDVDNTLIEDRTKRLRDEIDDLLSTLVDQGNTILLWSVGSGIYAEEKAEEYGIDGYVSGYYSKPILIAPEDRTDEEAFEALGGIRPDMSVDDNPKERIPGVDFIAVEPLMPEDKDDDDLDQALVGV